MPGRLLVASALLLLAAACHREPAVGPPPAPAANSEALFDVFVHDRTGLAPAQVSEPRKAALRTEFAELKAAADRGAKLEDATFQSELELQRLQMRARRAAAAAGVDQPPTDAGLRQAYQQYLATRPAEEFHLAHILVPSEAGANLLISRLAHGTAFATLAQSDSVDDSKSRGGDLGWMALEKLPPEFGAAVRDLAPGQYTMHPVHTRYGWHVIRLLERRAAAVPSYEQVRPQLEANWHEDRYRQFLKESLASARN